MVSPAPVLSVHSYLLVTLFLATGGLVLPFEGQAKGIDSEIERRAQEAFHGPDLEGKDGPMAKIGLDLARVYYERERALEEEEPLEAPASMQIDGGRVVVDAIAVSDSTETLRQSLAGLGAESLAVSGRVVSGRLPISALPEAAELSVLRSMTPSRARTQDQPELSPKYDMSDPVGGSGGGTSEEESDGNREERPPGSALGILLLIGTFLLVERT